MNANHWTVVVQGLPHPIIFESSRMRLDCFPTKRAVENVLKFKLGMSKVLGVCRRKSCISARTTGWIQLQERGNSAITD